MIAIYLMENHVVRSTSDIRVVEIKKDVWFCRNISRRPPYFSRYLTLEWIEPMSLFTLHYLSSLSCLLYVLLKSHSFSVSASFDI